MDDVRLVVKYAAQAVAAEIAHHAHGLRLDKALNGMADVAGGGAGFHRGDAAHHGLIGHLDQPFGFAGNRANGIHPAGIAIPALDDEGHVDVDNVAFLQHPVAGHAVADHVVDRGAGRIAIAAVHQGGGVGAMVKGEVADEIVDPRGRHARLDDIGQLVEALGYQRASLAHAGKAARPVQLDLPGLALGGIGGFDIAHGLIMVWRAADCNGRFGRPNLMIGAVSASQGWDAAWSRLKRNRRVSTVGWAARRIRISSKPRPWSRPAARRRECGFRAPGRAPGCPRA